MNRLAFSLGLVLSAFAVCTFITGCGGGDGGRQEVTGTVIFQGKPLPEGMIEFNPEDKQGTKEGAMIVNGEYKIPKDKGLLPGKYRIFIIGNNTASGAGLASPDAPGGGLKGGGARIPSKYNTDSEIIKEVTKGGPNKFDFTIS